MNIAEASQYIVAITWLLVAAALVYVVRAMRLGGESLGRSRLLAGLALGLALAASLTAGGLVFVRPGQLGVVVSAVSARGVRSEPLRPGLNWRIPGLERAVLYSSARETYTMSSNTHEGQIAGDDAVAARTRDGQVVFVEASLIYSIDPAQAVALHIDWGPRYTDEVVRPYARSVIRDAVSAYTVEETVSEKRSVLEGIIADGLAAGLKSNHLLLSSFLLRDVRFSPEYAAAVEQKQIAQQQAEQAALVVEQKKQEAEQLRAQAAGQADAAVIAADGAARARLIQAQAEAQALQQIAAALAENPDLLQYSYVQKLGDQVRVMLVPGNGLALPSK